MKLNSSTHSCRRRVVLSPLLVLASSAAHAQTIIGSSKGGGNSRTEQQLDSLRVLRSSRGDLESIERSLARLLRKPGRDARVIGKFRQIEARA